MSKKRFWNIVLLFVATLIFAIISDITVIRGRKKDPIIFCTLLCILTALAFVIRPLFEFNRNKRILAAIVLTVIFGAKHFFKPALSYVHAGAFSYSFVYNVGLLIGFLAVLELYQVKQNSLLIATYSFLLLTAASYTEITNLFLPAMIVYAITLVLYSRSFSATIKAEKKSNLWAWGLAISLLLCYTTGRILEHYREDLNSWNPGGSDAGKVMFSHNTRLGSKSLEISTQPVLRYLAPVGHYYLRGKAFDFYASPWWRLTKNKIIRLTPSQNAQQQRFFTHPKNKNLKSAYKHELYFVENQQGAYFAPLECQSIVLNDVALWCNREDIYFGNHQQQGKSVHMLVRKKNLVIALTKEELKRYTQLHNAPFFTKFSKKIVGSRDSAWKKINAIKDYFAKKYSYSLQIKLNKGIDPIEDFLQNQKSGHCEMFSSAFLMLARAQKIPCRYVGGYYVHEWNDLGKFFTVRACDAHAWTEVYFPDRGWVTVDPTPSKPLEDILKKQRGGTDKYREAFSEWLRQVLQSPKNLLNIPIPGKAIVIFGIIIILFILFRKKKLSFFFSKKTAIKQSVEQEPENTRRLQQLYLDFCQFSAGVEREKRPQETLREYYCDIEAKLPEPWQKFAQKLHSTLEDILYSKKNIGKETVVSLEEEYQKLHSHEN